MSERRKMLVRMSWYQISTELKAGVSERRKWKPLQGADHTAAEHVANKWKPLQAEATAG